MEHEFHYIARLIASNRPASVTKPHEETCNLCYLIETIINMQKKHLETVWIPCEKMTPKVMDLVSFSSDIQLEEGNNQNEKGYWMKLKY